MIKKIFAVLVAALICVSMLISASAVSEETTALPEDIQPADVEDILDITSLGIDETLLVDDADILTEIEEQVLLTKLNTYTEALKCEIAILSVNNTEGKNAQEYADDYYDYNGYGYDDTTDGILFLYSKDDNAWAVSTAGTGMLLTTDTIDSIVSGIGDYIRSGEYDTAFTEYADDIFNKLTSYISDEYPDLNSVYNAFTEDPTIVTPQKEHNPIIWLFIDLAIGFVIAFIIMKSKTSNLKSVKAQANANSYVVPNSLVVTGQSDSFLYTNVVKTPIPKNNTSGGSSNGTHISSSGSTHGGSSGHF